MTETDVYVKYGLLDKALDHVQKVLAIDPQHAPAHEKARELHLSAGRAEDAAQAGAHAVRAFLSQGDLDRAREALSRLRQIAPDWPELGALAATAGGTEEVQLAADEDEVVLSAAEVAEEPEEDDDALALAAAAADDDEVVEEDEPPARPAVYAPPAAERARPPPPAPARASPPPPVPRPAAPPPPVARAAAPRAPEEVDLSDEIEEADFFVQQGLLDDAREALQNLLAFYPEHPVLKAKLADVERKGGAAQAEAPQPAAADDASFDIARELAEMGGGATADAADAADEEFQYSVEDVFNQFKKGVEQTVKAEDSATHYDLGIAYKEMGLVDDAIHEFETALAGNDRKREVDCLSMIGLCHLAKADGNAAIAAFRRALASDRLTRDAAKAIHFELAAAHESGGDREAALYYFQRVAKADPAFREVAQRVAALGGGPGRAPPDERPRAASAAGGRAPPPRPVPPPASNKKNIGFL
jgi:tetratricopeptide (TPR) repeat protein